MLGMSESQLESWAYETETTLLKPANKSMLANTRRESDVERRPATALDFGWKAIAGRDTVATGGERAFSYSSKAGGRRKRDLLISEFDTGAETVITSAAELEAQSEAEKKKNLTHMRPWQFACNDHEKHPETATIVDGAVVNAVAELSSELLREHRPS
eukprot:7030328-Prymnesium_polylepis.1